VSISSISKTDNLTFLQECKTYRSFCFCCWIWNYRSS